MSEAEVRRWPQHSGFYWARCGGYEWYHLIVHVSGEVPFLRIRVWDYVKNVCPEFNIYDIAEFGPRIDEAKPDRTWSEFIKQLNTARGA